MLRLLLVMILSIVLAVAQEEAFTVETLVSGLEVPWDLVFAADGSLYFSERPGRISVFKDGVLTQLAGPKVFSNLRVEGEAGLMGLALEPSFPDPAYIYACYSYSNDDGEPRNRVVRLTLRDNWLYEEKVLLEDIPGSIGHNGCRLAIGPDQKLYIAMGDAFRQDSAQDPETLGGKILRLNLDGSIPADNPFGNAVWTLGHRNPQGLAFHPSGRLYASEHGPDTNDELNHIEKGKNYGWPLVVGQRERQNFVPALRSYFPRSTIAIAGLDVYQGDKFPWQNNLLFVSLKAGQFYRVMLHEDGSAVSDEVLLDRTLNSDLGRLRDVAVSPDGYVFLATSNRNDRNNNPHPDDDRIVVLRPK